MGQITQTTTQLQTILNDADASNAGNTSISDASDTSATSLKKSGFYSLQASSSNAPSTDRAVVISAVRDTAATGEIRYGQVVITESNGLWWNSDDGGSLGTWYESVATTATQTLTNKTLTSPVLTTPQINDSAADHQYVFAVANLAADRTVTLPLLTGADTFVFEAHAQTLTNKILTAPVLSGSASAAGSILFKEDTDNGTNAVTLIGPAATADVTVTLPAATDTLVGKATTDTLTNKTITSVVLNTGVSGSAVLDSDTMSGASATTLSSSESIKAYVDAQVDTADTLAEILAIGNTTGGTDIATTTTDKVQFRDAAIYINSSVDGQLDIVADSEIQLAATTIDINGAINASGEIIAASLDISGNIDVDGVTNLDVVDIDGAVNMATTALVTGVLTTTATQVATGGITSGADIISDTDSTDSLGSTAVRWLKGWFDTLTAGTLTIGSGSVTDSSGAISFGNENLTTTGTATAASLALATGATVTGVDNGTLGTSATLLATQGAIKTYVDAQVDTADTLAEVLALGNTTGGTDLAVSAGDDITFTDSSKAIFGAGSDLQIYHDGSNSWVSDQGTGQLILESGGAGVYIQKGASETMANFIADGAVSLYHNNVKKIETTALGISVAGAATFNAGAVFNESSIDSDFRVESNGNANMLFVDGGSDHVNIGTASDYGGMFNVNGKMVVKALDGALANDFIATFQNGEETNSQSFGVSIAAASTGSDIALNVVDHDASNVLLRVFGNGATTIGGSVTATGATLSGDLNLDVAASPSIVLVGGDGNSKNIFFKKQTGDTEEARIKVLSNNMILDVKGEIHLDADDGVIRVQDAAGDIGMFQMTNSDFIIRSMVSDKDIIFKGLDGSSVISALTLDMSDFGSAAFNAAVDVGTTLTAQKLVLTNGVAGQGNANLKFSNSADAITPANSSGSNNDNAIDLGASSARFDDIYATNATIQTSDRNEKQDIAELSDAEQRVAVACKGLLRKFRWKSSVAEKGDKARTHFGIIAQDLEAAFVAEGLDASDYAMFINTAWTDEETSEEKIRMGVRYSELLAFIISAI